MRTHHLPFVLLGSALFLGACAAVTNPPSASDTTGSVDFNIEESSMPTMEANSNPSTVDSKTSVYVYWEGFNPYDFDKLPEPDCAQSQDQEKCMVEFFCEPANSEKLNECRQRMPGILRESGML